METSMFGIIKYDYLAKVLTVICAVAFALLLGILAAGESSVLGIILPVVIVLAALIAFRAIVVKKVLDRIKDNKVIGTVIGTRRNNGNFYITFNYEFKGEAYKNKVSLLIGPLLRVKLTKMETMNLVVDDQNPKKVYLSDLFYK